MAKPDWALLSVREVVPNPVPPRGFERSGSRLSRPRAKNSSKCRLRRKFWSAVTLTPPYRKRISVPLAGQVETDVAAIRDVTRKTDLSATHAASQVLHFQLVLVEDERPIDFAQRRRQVDQRESRMRNNNPSVHDRFRRRTFHRQVSVGRSVRGNLVV